MYMPSQTAQITSHSTPQAEHVLGGGGGEGGGGGAGGEACRGHVGAQEFGVGVYFSLANPGGGGGWCENAPPSEGVRLEMSRNTASVSMSAYSQYLYQHITTFSLIILLLSRLSTYYLHYFHTATLTKLILSVGVRFHFINVCRSFQNLFCVRPLTLVA